MNLAADGSRRTGMGRIFDATRIGGVPKSYPSRLAFDAGVIHRIGELCTEVWITSLASNALGPVAFGRSMIAIWHGEGNAAPSMMAGSSIVNGCLCAKTASSARTLLRAE
jgi:hypothetical protein